MDSHHLKQFLKSSSTGLQDTINIWATSNEKTCLCHVRTKKAQISLHSLISTFVRCLHSIISLLSKSKISIACLCGSTSWFQSYLIRNPEDRFSRDRAHTGNDIKEIRPIWDSCHTQCPTKLRTFSGRRFQSPLATGRVPPSIWPSSWWISLISAGVIASFNIASGGAPLPVVCCICSMTNYFWKKFKNTNEIKVKKSIYYFDTMFSISNTDTHTKHGFIIPVYKIISYLAGSNESRLHPSFPRFYKSITKIVFQYLLN